MPPKAELAARIYIYAYRYTYLSLSRRLAASPFLVVRLLLLLLLLLGLHGGDVDVPYEEALEDQHDEGADERVEDVGLVVERRDGLGRGADLGQEGELARHWGAGARWCRHGGGGGWMCSLDKWLDR